MYSFLRGRQGIQGVTGPTGPTGSPGVAGNKFSIAGVGAPVITGTGTITIFPLSTATGAITFFGQISFDSSASSLITIMPRVNGVNASTYAARQSVAAGQSTSISFVGAATISIGQSFDLFITVSVGTGTVTTGGVSYSIL